MTYGPTSLTLRVSDADSFMVMHCCNELCSQCRLVRAFLSIELSALQLFSVVATGCLRSMNATALRRQEHSSSDDAFDFHLYPVHTSSHCREHADVSGFRADLSLAESHASDAEWSGKWLHQLPNIRPRQLNCTVAELRTRWNMPVSLDIVFSATKTIGSSVIRRTESQGASDPAGLELGRPTRLLLMVPQKHHIWQRI